MPQAQGLLRFLYTFKSLPLALTKQLSFQREMCLTQGASYRGIVAETHSGQRCQAWNFMSPHVHSFTPERFPNSGLECNYCRAPAPELTGLDGVWCFSTGTQVLERCDVPFCDDVALGKDSETDRFHSWAIAGALLTSLLRSPFNAVC
jgi:Kringle domain